MRSNMPIFQLKAYKVATMVGLFMLAALYWHVEAHAGQSVLQTGFQDTDASAVRVQFVGESLCPDCAAFTTDILDPVYTSDLKDIVDLDYIGWGNAKNTSGTPECQHGPRECKLNKVLNCAEHYSRYPTQLRLGFYLRQGALNSSMNCFPYFTIVQYALWVPSCNHVL